MDVRYFYILAIYTDKKLKKEFRELKIGHKY